MLTHLSIRDIVLIDRLDLAFDRGLAVLTGETGAGKSILLDAFALALGARGVSRTHPTDERQALGRSVLGCPSLQVRNGCFLKNVNTP